MSESVFFISLIIRKTYTLPNRERHTPSLKIKPKKRVSARETLFTKHVPSPGIEPGFKV